MLPQFLKANTTTSDTEGTNLVSRQMEMAEAIVNGYVAARYDLSAMISIPPILRTLAEDICVFNVIKSTNYRYDQRNQYMDDYKRAFDTLAMIKDGEIKLSFTNGSLMSEYADTVFMSSTEDFAQVFNLDEPTNWDTNQTQKDDIANGRL
jgi:phage gp36-like protein